MRGRWNSLRVAAAAAIGLSSQLATAGVLCDPAAVIVCPASIIQVNDPSKCSAVVFWDDPIVTDGCAPAVSCDPKSSINAPLATIRMPKGTNFTFAGGS